MLTKQELENIKPGDRITYSDYNLSTSAYEDVEGTVVETRVRCGEQGDVMEDYLILDDGTEVDYTNVSKVVGHKQNNERAIKSTIGRFKLTEIHEDTYTYSMADEDHEGGEFHKVANVSSVLTAPDSTFKFWTNVGHCSVHWVMFGSCDKRWTLTELKTPANRDVNEYVGSPSQACRYVFTLDVSDD